MQKSKNKLPSHLKKMTSKWSKSKIRYNLHKNYELNETFKTIDYQTRI